MLVKGAHGVLNVAILMKFSLLPLKLSLMTISGAASDENLNQNDDIFIAVYGSAFSLKMPKYLTDNIKSACCLLLMSPSRQPIDNAWLPEAMSISFWSEAVSIRLAGRLDSIDWTGIWGH